MSIHYRPDIDGLRALAVLSVLLFHLDLAGIMGGYIGVDIFFVISGFLITSIILQDLSNNRFSLSNFFERRIRRIFPALFTVLFVSLIAGYIVLFPQSFEDFGISLSAAAGFGANILFWKQSGYFETEAHLMPLLHIWSLGVEEQFYIFFPLALLLIHKFFKRVQIPLIIVAFFLSLLISIIGLHFGKYSAVFYLLPARAWELMVGSLLALGFIPSLKNKIALNALSLTGFILILFSALQYNTDTLFPGIAALLPTLGTAFIIYAGMQKMTLINHLLSCKPFVFTGKISYPLYLWHWPLIVFYNYASPIEMNIYSALIILAGSFLLSILTSHYIEKPIRYNQELSQNFIFISAAGISFLCILIGLTIYDLKGMPDRFPEDIQKLSTVSIGTKIPHLKDYNFEGNSGILGDIDQTPTFIVWGDSHARATTPALNAIAKQLNKKGYLLEDSGCMPSAQAISIMDDSCNHFNKQAMDFTLSTPNIDRVIFIARWSAYAKRLKNHAPDTLYFEEYMAQIFNILKNHDKDIYFVTEIPQASLQNPALYLARAKYYNQTSSNIEMSFKTHLKQQDIILTALRQLSKKHDFNTFYPHDALCENAQCHIIHDGQSLYYDDDHLSTYGAIYIQDHYKTLFE